MNHTRVYTLRVCRKFMLSWALLLCCIGCSRFEIVQTTIQVPPQNPESLGKIHRMALIDFGSQKFPAIADNITNKLLQRLLKVKGLELVEREKVKALIDEQKFSQTDYVDPNEAIEMGRMLGVDHFMMGTVLSYRAYDEQGNFTDMESVQSGTNVIYVDGRPVAVPQWSQVPINRNFKVRNVEVSVNFRVVDAQTGAVRMANSITRTYTSQRAVDGRALPAQDQLLDDLLEQCISEIMTHFEYHQARIEKSLSTRAGLAKGNKYLQNGLLPEAEAYYRRILERHPDNADANYNLGVVLEIKHDYEGAVEHYQKAVMADDGCKIFQQRLRIARAALQRQ
ncbi:tetratricopeptide repeat protein [Candidatus Sumerlaeota bacterium]|nr:tetratricopeptide repeat protein [Candidatus Sumerlaeota bacterium]